MRLRRRLRQYPGFAGNLLGLTDQLELMRVSDLMWKVRDTSPHVVNSLR